MPSGRRGEEERFTLRTSAGACGTAVLRAVPKLPLRSCEYLEEQPSVVVTTAWGPFLLEAAEQALFSGRCLLSGCVSGARS